MDTIDLTQIRHRSGMPSKLSEAWKRARNKTRSGLAMGSQIVRNADRDEATLFLYGPIGEDFWGDGASAKDVVDQLAEVTSRSLRVRINSPGGDVFDGLAIYQAIRGFEGDKIVQIDGLAASAAAVIAMAGDLVEMAPASMLMIHDAWGLMMGNAQDAEEFAAVLHKIDSQLAGVFAAKTGKPADELRQKMDAETWFTAEEAVAYGLADGLLSQYNPDEDEDDDEDEKDQDEDEDEDEEDDEDEEAARRRAAAALAKIRVQELDSHALVR